MTYPDGSVMNYVYGTTADVNDKISRVTGMKATSFDATDNVVQYGYVGLGMAAEVDYPVPDVQLDRTFSHNGKRRTQGYAGQAAGTYPGFDRFGRVLIQPWMDGSLDEHATDSTLPNQPPILEETYSYDRDSNRLSRYDDRPGAHLSDRDFDYTYDGLDRLIKAERGVQGAPMTLGVGSQEWALDMLGSWTEVRTDLNGNGTYTDTDEKDTRTHNEANEIDDRLINTSPTTPALPLAYDDAGNVKAHGRGGTATDKYVHDAWNRLVLVKTDTTDIPPTSTTIGEYEYNALHWRIVKRADTTLPIDGLDQERVMYYASDWRMIEERIDEGGYDSDPATYDRLAQQFWGMRYIDDAVLRRIDTDNDGTWETTDENNFYITDVQFSVRAMIAATNASLQERTNYNAYGVGEHRWPADFDGDDVVDSTDSGMIFDLNNRKNIDQSGYKADLDLNRDGSVDTADIAVFLNWNGKSALTPGHISDPNGPDSAVGFDGYLFNPETMLYLARFRNYDPTLGRWMERDLIGGHITLALPSHGEGAFSAVDLLSQYRDGSSLYEYVSSMPLDFVDPSGLDGEMPSKYIGYTSEQLQDLIDAENRKLSQCGGAKNKDARKAIKKKISLMKKAQKQVEQAPRIKPKVKNPKQTPRNRGRRGFATKGTLITLVISMAVLLDEAGHRLGDRGDPCHQYLDSLQMAIDSGKCNVAQLERLGQNCSEKILAEIGGLAASNQMYFDMFRDEVRDACAEMLKCPAPGGGGGGGGESCSDTN